MNITRTRFSPPKEKLFPRVSSRDWKFIAQFPAQQYDNISDEILGGPRRVIPLGTFGTRVPSGPLRLFLSSQTRGMCHVKNNTMLNATPREIQKPSGRRRTHPSHAIADDLAKSVLSHDGQRACWTTTSRFNHQSVPLMKGSSPLAPRDGKWELYASISHRHPSGIYNKTARLNCVFAHRICGDCEREFFLDLNYISAIRILAYHSLADPREIRPRQSLRRIAPRPTMYHARSVLHSSHDWPLKRLLSLIGHIQGNPCLTRPSNREAP